MELINVMPTLSQVLNKLARKGMDNDLRWTKNGFTIDSIKTYQPHELTIIKVYRFEELKDPGDLCILYLMQANDGVTGYVLDAYGVYSCHDEEGFDNAIRLIPKKIARTNCC